MIGAVLKARRAEKPVTLWWMIPMFVLWAHLHAGVLIGVGLLGVITLGEGFEGWREKSSSQQRLAKHLGILTVCGFLATLITPYTYHIYENFAATVMNSTAMNMVGEWASPDFHSSFGKSIEVYLAVAVASLLF